MLKFLPKQHVRISFRGSQFGVIQDGFLAKTSNSFNIITYFKDKSNSNTWPSPTLPFFHFLKGSISTLITPYGSLWQLKPSDRRMRQLPHTGASRIELNMEEVYLDWNLVSPGSCYLLPGFTNCCSARARMHSPVWSIPQKDLKHWRKTVIVYCPMNLIKAVFVLIE